MVRGVNRQTIFEDDEDCVKFIDTIQQNKDKSGLELYGYCLMGNHAHILLREGKEALSLSMQRICSSFVYWYNWKYDRFGHLFQERFKSEPVEDEAYSLTVLRYIHQNPIKAGITKAMKEYKWSSYHEYISKQSIIDTELILEMFATERQTARQRFEIYMSEVNEDVCLDYEDRHRIGDEEILKLIEEKYKVKKGFFHLLERSEMNMILRDLKSINGITIRQLVRVTGVSKFTVEKA
jgi:REP element-mobilizing transposase RayT